MTKVAPFTARSSCRVCGSENLVPVLSLPPQYLNDFPDPSHEKDGDLVPIDLDLCQSCSLVQARYTVRQDLLYTGHYWYKSGVTETMRSALAAVTRSAMGLTRVDSGHVVLDIGSNDGTLLRAYRREGLVKVGVEPADNLQDEGSRGVDILIHDFWNFDSYWRRVGRQAKIITACGMFYDLEDPNQFISDVAKVLDGDGVFVAQLMCLRDMVDLADVGNLSHEHLEFYSFRSLEKLFGRHGLTIVDVEWNSVNGSSHRFTIQHAGCPPCCDSGSYRRICEARSADEELADPRIYQSFRTRLETNKDHCVSFIRQARERGKSVWVYGASTKGNVILQYYGLDKTLIRAAAERSPSKWGKVTVGTGIPIVSEEEFRTAGPDYALVLPYAFLPEFQQREKHWLDCGGRFLVPLPEFRAVGPTYIF